MTNVTWFWIRNDACESYRNSQTFLFAAFEFSARIIDHVESLQDLESKAPVSQLVNAEVNSGSRIKSGTRIKLRYKDSWTPSVPSQQSISGCVSE